MPRMEEEEKDNLTKNSKSISFSNMPPELVVLIASYLDVTSYLAFASSSRPGKLGSHAQRMTELCLASPEFPKGLCDRHGLDATLQQGVKRVTASRDSLDVHAALEDFGARAEPLVLYLLCNLVALVSLSFCDAFDVEHLLLGAAKNKFD